MKKIENDWYNKGYEDGFSDAINNPDLESIIEKIENLSREEKQKIYVKLFADDQMECCTDKRNSQIQTILRNYKNNVLTSLEAIKSIVDSYYNNL